jgi:hypothetical protein
MELATPGTELLHQTKTLNMVFLTTISIAHLRAYVKRPAVCVRSRTYPRNWEWKLSALCTGPHANMRSNGL